MKPLIVVIKTYVRNCQVKQSDVELFSKSIYFGLGEDLEFWLVTHNTCRRDFTFTNITVQDLIGNIRQR